MNTLNSQTLYDRALDVFPGGVNSPVRAWKSVGGNPLFFARGSGSHLTDADGNTFIDYVGSWGPLILGHAHPKVVNAIRQTAELGTSFGAPSPLEVELGERIRSAVPSMEMLRFVSSGTEATMSAIRLARAFTGRSKIVKFEGGYHGHADFLLSKAGSGVATFSLPDSAGVPPEIASTTLVVPFNDLVSVKRTFTAHKGEIAAIIAEPIPANMGVVLPEPRFLEELAQVAHNNDALLIMDEVITGFRVAWGGAQSIYAVQPDLTCLGKIIGGGLPVGAYGGRKEIMALVAPLGPVYQAGTLSGNPLAMAAGIATLDAISATPNAYERLDSLGAALQDGLATAASDTGVPLVINRIGSAMTPFFVSQNVCNYTSAKAADSRLYARYFHGMLERGIYLPPSQFEAAFLSLAHTEEDIHKTISAARQVFRELSK